MLISIMVLAYHLNDKPVFKSIRVNPLNVNSTYIQDPNNYKEDRPIKCWVYLNQPVNGKDFYLSTETCEAINNKKNKATWENK